ncbi:MAG: transcriptional regulator [Deltaproteobacteria bacterium GWA2_38_16]|nr:MAG: transcriptional regulator [Deltaproteobacteria bacterium GWA2_38_16]OGQ02113.1 MAG: transcriptional regulator [Deltaproteobacteria bacterium RIFCSPHIGHO2_02_FULL_38_15]HBQ21494.1 transcriptional regulator [Deltaproteobacteria bacterium]
MNVQILDLKKQYEALKPQIQTAIQRVLDQGIYVLGPEVQKLEKDLAQYVGSPHALGTSSGTDALLLALLTIGIEPNDEVITTPLSFVATSEVISFLKAKPVFVDVDPQTFCIDPTQIEAAITSKTKAIIPVHIFGQCADMDPILDIAKKHKLFVIEDACQAIGAEYKGRKAGSMGDFGALSFYPSKNLGTYGDGGMLFVKDEKNFISAREYRTHGEYPKTYNHKKIGMNARLAALPAAVLNVKFPYIDQWNEQRREKAQTYYRLFEEAGLLNKITLPKVASYNKPVFHLYVILTQHKNNLIEHLKSNGIQTGNHFPTPLPYLECYKEAGYIKGNLPNAEKICSQTVSLPMYPELTLEEQQYVVSKIRHYYSNL